MGITHHKALSVTSGYWIGDKGSEREVFNMSGTIASGAVTMNSIAPIFDYGTCGASGHTESISTKIASIVTAYAISRGVLATANSGIDVHVSWSGNYINIYKYASNGSAATSSQVAWTVFG
ncbi:MAG TPA: hypothetical protein VIY48_08520 [Candidatus Paceibacterota bacterium]